MNIPSIFNRLHLLTGTAGYEALNNSRVLLVGVGGVGSWCGEALVRSGIGHITLVDSDKVCETNINRQLPATKRTVGQYKVEVLAERFKELNPECDVVARPEIFFEENVESFDLDSYDYVIDAIDSLDGKLSLITNALRSKATLFSSMGAACKSDPTRIKVAKMKDTYACPLARIMRNRLKREGIRNPNFKVVFSDELLENYCTADEPGTVDPCSCCADGNVETVYTAGKKANGSLVFVTGVFGFNLASLVFNDVLKQTESLKRMR